MIEEVFFLQNDQDRRAELRPNIEILSFWGESIDDYLFLLDVEKKNFIFPLVFGKNILYHLWTFILEWKIGFLL